MSVVGARPWARPILVTPATSTHPVINTLVIDIMDKTGTFELGKVELDASFTSMRINCDTRQVTNEVEFLKKCASPRHRHEPITEIVTNPRYTITLN